MKRYLLDQDGALRVDPFTRAPLFIEIDDDEEPEWPEPPQIEPRQAAVFDTQAGAWSIVVDHRGELWRDAAGQAVTVVGLGDPTAQGLIAAADDSAEPPPAGPATKSELISYAGDARSRAEDAGTTWSGYPVSTTDAAKTKLLGARIAAMANSSFETTWWMTNGEGVVVDAPLIVALSDAVLAHVDGTFTTFGLVRAAIETGEITSREEIDAAFVTVQP